MCLFRILCYVHINIYICLGFLFIHILIHFKFFLFMLIFACLFIFVEPCFILFIVILVVHIFMLFIYLIKLPRNAFNKLNHPFFNKLSKILIFNKLSYPKIFFK